MVDSSVLLAMVDGYSGIAAIFDVSVNLLKSSNVAFPGPPNGVSNCDLGENSVSMCWLLG